MQILTFREMREAALLALHAIHLLLFFPNITDLIKKNRLRKRELKRKKTHRNETRNDPHLVMDPLFMVFQVHMVMALKGLTRSLRPPRTLPGRSVAIGSPTVHFHIHFTLHITSFTSNHSV